MTSTQREFEGETGRSLDLPPSPPPCRKIGFQTRVGKSDDRIRGAALQTRVGESEDRIRGTSRLPPGPSGSREVPQQTTTSQRAHESTKSYLPVSALSSFAFLYKIIGVGGPKRSPHGIGFSCMPGRGRGSVVGGVPGKFFSVRTCVRASVRPWT